MLLEAVRVECYNILLLDQLCSVERKLSPLLENKRKPEGGKKEGGKGGGGGAKTKNKKNTSTKSHQKKDEAWKKQPPKEGEPHTKEVAGKKFQWCIHHMAWDIHSASECRLGASRKDPEGKGKETSPSSKTRLSPTPPPLPPLPADLASPPSSPSSLTTKNDGARWHVRGG